MSFNRSAVQFIRIPGAAALFNWRSIMLKFIRTTHDAGGQLRPFPSAAWQFWQEHGQTAGQLLRPETPLTFDEFLLAAAEQAFECITDGPQPTSDAAYLAWCLLRLVEFGMAAVIIDPPTPLESAPSRQLPLEYIIPNRVTAIQ
jgi:hypothetical protein